MKTFIIELRSDYWEDRLLRFFMWHYIMSTKVFKDEFQLVVKQRKSNTMNVWHCEIYCKDVEGQVCPGISFESSDHGIWGRDIAYDRKFMSDWILTNREVYKDFVIGNPLNITYNRDGTWESKTPNLWTGKDTSETIMIFPGNIETIPVLEKEEDVPTAVEQFVFRNQEWIQENSVEASLMRGAAVDKDLALAKLPYSPEQHLQKIEQYLQELFPHRFKKEE